METDNTPGLEIVQASAAIYNENEKGNTSASVSPSPTYSTSLEAEDNLHTSKGGRKKKKVNKTRRRVSVVTKEKNEQKKFAAEMERVQSIQEMAAASKSRRIKDQINAVVNHTAFTCIDTILTFYVLLMPNFQDIFIPVSADGVLYTMNILIFVFFVFEVAVLTFAEKGYAPRTYFWLDIVATASLIVDMVPSDSIPQRELSLAGSQDEAFNVVRLTEMVGRLGRTVRLVRLFRQLRILNVLIKNLNQTGDDDDEVGKTDEEKKQASLLVSKVSDRMSRRVVIIILVSVVTVMLLEVPNISRSREDSIRILASAAENGTNSTAYLNAEYQLLALRREGNGKLLELTVNNKTVMAWAPAPAMQESEFRYNQWERLIINNKITGLQTVASFNLIEGVKTSANFNIGIIFAITSILFFFAILLSWDSVKLIQGPFTKMVRAEKLSQALLSVFKMAANSDDINTVSTSIVQTAHRLLECQRINLYFVEDISKQIVCMHSSNSRMKDKSLPRTIWSRASSTLNFRQMKGGPSNNAEFSVTSEGKTLERKGSDMKRQSNLSIHTQPSQFESFSIALSKTEYTPVQVANDGKMRNISRPTTCFIGHEYESKSTLVIPVRNAANKVVAVVEAVNKKGHSGFGEEDGETLRLFCNQLGAVIGKRALDAVYANLLNSSSNLDATARSLLQQASGYTSAPSTPTNGHTDEESSQKQVEERRFRNRQSSLVIEMNSALSAEDAKYHAELVKYQAGLLQASTEHLNKLTDWSTHLFDFSEEELAYGFVAMMLKSGLLSEFGIPRMHLLNFVFAAKDVYNDVTYHNFYHGFNVFQVCYKMIGETGVGELLDSIDQLALLVGALSHDMGHRGMNNSFHKAMYLDDPLIPKLALTYNDVAVLENMHASRAFEIMTRPKHNVFSSLSLKNHQEARRMMCRGILATDMEHHMKHVKMLQNHSSFSNSREDRTFLVEISMHTADLSNPIQPWKNSSEWAVRVAKEFSAQYEKETELGLAQTPHFNLEGEINASNPSIAKLNIGFANYLVKPLWVTFVDFFPKWAKLLGKWICWKILCCHLDTFSLQTIMLTQ